MMISLPVPVRSGRLGEVYRIRKRRPLVRGARRGAPAEVAPDGHRVVEPFGHRLLRLYHGRTHDGTPVVEVEVVYAA